VDGRRLKKSPEIINDLKKAIEEFTAGDPMLQECKWVRFSLRKLCLEMEKLGYSISLTTLRQQAKITYSLTIDNSVLMSLSGDYET
jgi:hypothetical protein